MLHYSVPTSCKTTKNACSDRVDCFCQQIQSLTDARRMSTAAVILKTTGIKTKPKWSSHVLHLHSRPDESEVYYIQGCPCLNILEFSNKKTKYLKILLPEIKKMSSFNLWCEVLLCIVLLKYSPNLALDQQDRKNPLSNKSFVKDCSVKYPQNVHTRQAKVHSPVESI